MGLDTVELVMEIEDRFQVNIPDESAGAMYTVGDIYRFLTMKTPVQASPTCRTATAFYQLRRTLCKEFAFIRQQVRPSTPTAHFFPEEFRLDAWAKLQSSLSCTLPALQGSWWRTTRKGRAGEFPPEAATLGGLARCLAIQETKLWCDLCEIISDQLGVAIERLTPATRIVQDLSCD